MSRGQVFWYAGGLRELVFTFWNFFMSRLVLVRHGQARFFSVHYERLSELGLRLSRGLGGHGFERVGGFDEVDVGTLPVLRERAGGGGGCCGDGWGVWWGDVRLRPLHPLAFDPADTGGPFGNLQHVRGNDIAFDPRRFGHA